jgi:hypothetical protein
LRVVAAEREQKRERERDGGASHTRNKVAQRAGYRKEAVSPRPCDKKRSQWSSLAG